MWIWLCLLEVLFKIDYNLCLKAEWENMQYVHINFQEYSFRISAVNYTLQSTCFQWVKYQMSFNSEPGL